MKPAQIAILLLVASCAAAGQPTAPSPEKQRAIDQALTAAMSQDELSAAGMEQRYVILTDPVLNEYFNAIGQRLAEAAGLHVPLSIKILDSDENFARPYRDRSLFLTARLISENADGSVISAILAHQVAHIALPPILSPPTRIPGATFPLRFMGGGSGFCSDYNKRSLRSTRLAFWDVQDRFESEADALASELLRKSGLDENPPGPAPLDHLPKHHASLAPTLRR